jgi:hypothetical protein
LILLAYFLVLSALKKTRGERPESPAARAA